MPDDVKEMLGLPVQSTKRASTLRSSSEPRSPRTVLSSHPSPSKKRQLEKQRSKQDIFVTASVSEKFAQQEKRNQMDAFFAKSKKEYQSAENKKVSVTNNSGNVDEGEKKDSDLSRGQSSSKFDLADVIIAAAAAKTVKLKSKGKCKLFLQVLYTFY